MTRPSTRLFHHLAAFGLVLLAQGGAWAQTAFSSRSAGLNYAFHAFSDDALGVNFNPAFISRARVFDSSISFTRLPFNNSAGTVAGMLPLNRAVLGLSASFAFPDGEGGNPIYVDGLQTGGLTYGDVVITGGASYAISRNLSAGFSLTYENDSFLGQSYFGTWVTAGARYENRFFRNLPLRFGFDISKKMLGNLTAPASGLEPGLRMNLTGALTLPTIRSEVGLELGFMDGDPARLVQASNTTFFDSLGIGFEALRDFYVSPKVSLRLPVFNKSLALGAGLSAGLPIRDARYEFGYALIKDFTADPVTGALRHHFSLSIRGHLDPFSRVRRIFLVLPEKSSRFGELVVQPAPSVPLPPGLLDNRVAVTLQKAALPGDRGEIDDLTTYANLSVEARLKGMARLRSEGAPEISVVPGIRIEGETLTLYMEAYNGAGERLFSRGYNADYARPIDKEEMVDRVRYVARGKEMNLLSFSESYHQKKNKQSLLEFLSRWEKDFVGFIESEYLKPVSLAANLNNPEVSMNGLRLGPLGAEGLNLKLKPGYYQFSAKKKGYPDVAVRRFVGEAQRVELNFPTNIFSVSVMPILLSEKSGVDLMVAGKTQKLKKGFEKPFDEVLSTNRSASLAGYYNIRSIPLGIADSRDRQIFLMPDFVESFRLAGFWKAVGDGFDLRPQFTPEGLGIHGVKEGVQPAAKGVQSPPFFVRDFSLSFMVASEEGGMGLVVLVAEGGKKWALVAAKQKVWVQSDFEGSAPGDIKARSLLERDQTYKLIKRDKTITLTLGDVPVYSGSFPEAGNMRLFVGADATREGERVHVNMPELSFKHL